MHIVYNANCCLTAHSIDLLRHIGLLEADEDKIRPKGTQVRMLYVPREVDLADGQGERSDPSLSARSTSLGTYSILT